MKKSIPLLLLILPMLISGCSNALAGSVETAAVLSLEQIQDEEILNNAERFIRTISTEPIVDNQLDTSFPSGEAPEDNALVSVSYPVVDTGQEYCYRSINSIQCP